MKVEKLDIRHQGLLHKRLREVEFPISEYSFPNLYLFRDVHGYEVLTDGEIYVRGRTYDGYRYLMPTADAEKLDIDSLKGLLKDVDFLFPVPEERLGLFPEDDFERSSHEGESDYIYLVEKMSTYAGRDMHKKKNLLNYFTSRYNHEALPLTKDRMQDAFYILDRWQETQGKRSGVADYLPCREALKLYDELILCGGIYYAEGEPVGFIVGEEVNDETFVLHFAKARMEFKGVYQYMFHNFAGLLPQKYRYLNFEPDLDIEALRHAKESYHPEFKLRKYRVALRK
jgi:hypothetical protein